MCWLLKNNHPQSYEDVRDWMGAQTAQGWVRQLMQIEKDHGRLETRRVSVSTELDWLTVRAEWPALKALVMVESQRGSGGQRRSERRYYLSNLTDPERIGRARTTRRRIWR